MNRISDIVLVCLALAACSRERDGRTGMAAASGSGGAGGIAVDGAGGEPSTSAASSTSHGCATATAGGWGADENGCGGDDFVEAAADPVVTSDGVAYEPRCLEIVRGTTVRFIDDFAAHPLVGGVVVDDQGIADASSPIPETRRGAEATAELERPGDFGFFCDHHATLGMAGMIRVR